MSAPQLLYISFNGVLEPLGYSQVARVLLGLARLGFRYHLLTLERDANLRNTSQVEQLRAELEAQGITWTHHAYRSGKPGATINLSRLAASALRICRRQGVELLHARGYQGTAVALAVSKLLGVPYIFDARGRWIDERSAANGWLKRPRIAAATRAAERALYANAAGIVTLTRLHADDIVGGVFGRYRGQPLEVVTTCADYDDFELARPEAAAASVHEQIFARLKGKRLLALVGSHNISYRQKEALDLASRILARNPDFHLVILTAQIEAFENLIRQASVPPGRYDVMTVAHRDMPSWLRRTEWAIQLLSEDVAKRGSMPTKLAEFFAAGVRPIHFGCNSEVTEWVRTAGSGYVLPSLEPHDLERAAELVGASQPDPTLLTAARQRTASHFDLASGLERYRLFLNGLLHRE